jgi:hypothetical protein
MDVNPVVLLYVVDDMLVAVNNFDLVRRTRVVTALTELVLLYRLVCILVRKVYPITPYWGY